MTFIIFRMSLHKTTGSERTLNNYNTMSQLCRVKHSLTPSKLLPQRIKPKPGDMWKVDFDIGQVLNCHWLIRCWFP